MTTSANCCFWRHRALGGDTSWVRKGSGWGHGEWRMPWFCHGFCHDGISVCGSFLISFGRVSKSCHWQSSMAIFCFYLPEPRRAITFPLCGQIHQRVCDFTWSGKATEKLQLFVSRDEWTYKLGNTAIGARAPTDPSSSTKTQDVLGFTQQWIKVVASMPMSWIKIQDYILCMYVM